MCCITFNWREGNTRKKFDYFREKKSISWSVIEVTDFCNFNCEWCYAASGYECNIERHQMSFEQVKMLIDHLSDSNVKQVTFSGGEPTIYPYIKESISYAKNKGMVVHMNTNCYVLDKKKLKDLMDCGLSQIETNIDSIHPEKHDTIRGKSGSFEKTIETLKNAVEMDLTCVVQTVMTKHNEDEIMDIVKLAKSVGVHRYRLWDVMPSGTALGKSDIRPSDYLAMVKKVDEFASKTGAQSLESGEPLFPLDYKTKLDVIDFPCVCACGLLINISTKGDVYFCATYRKPLYNIFEAIENGENIAEFHKLKLAEFLKKEGTPQKCTSCRFFDRCGGGCLTRRGYTENGVDYWCKIN